MPTTFNVFYLGNFASIDPTEGNVDAENAAALVGQTIGNAGSPFYNNIQEFSPGTTGFAAGGTTVYDSNNSAANDTFSIDGGADQTFDGYAIYNITVTYTDGSTASIAALIFQDTAGNSYLAPTTSTGNPDQDGLEAKAIESISIDSILIDTNVAGMIGDRAAGDYLVPDGLVVGEQFAENMSFDNGYQDAQGDFISNTEGDAVYGANGDDTIRTGGGNDSVQGGEGNDSIRGGVGDDYLEPGGGSDSIYGDAGNDTLVLSDNDFLDGGDDTDTLDETFGNFGETVIFNADNSGSTDNGSTFQNIEVFLSDGGADNYDASAATGPLTISTGDDNDTIIGGAGNDILLPGRGDDLVEGGAGNDTITNTSGRDVLDGGAGNDSITGSSHNTLIGGDGDDIVTSSGISWVIFHIDNDDGNDVLIGYEGGGGGSGTDNLMFFATTSGDGVTVTYDTDQRGGTWANDGTYTYNGPSGTATGTFTGMERLDGTENADVFDASSSLAGLGGIWTHGGDDLVLGSVNDDVVIVGSGNNTVYGGDGQDYIEVDSFSGVASNNQIFAGAGNDDVQIYGTNINATIDGGTGNDAVWADSGTIDFTYVLQDGFGNDTISVWNTNLDTGPGDGIDASALTSGVTVSFTTDQDGTLVEGVNSVNFEQLEWFDLTGLADIYDGTGSTLARTIDGGGGADSLTGGTGADTLLGGAGNDTIVVEDGMGNDSLVGGDQTDLIDMSAVTSGITLTFSSNFVGTFINGSDTVSIADFEFYRFTDQADIIDANSGGISLSGTFELGGGDDSYFGGGAMAETVLAGTGNDTVVARGNNSSVSGGEGDDSITIEFGNNSTLDGGAGNDSLVMAFGSGGTLVGGDGNDTLTGRDADDSLSGGVGNDSLFGGRGADTLVGGDGQNTLTGGDGNDSLVGNATDVNSFTAFESGAGADTLDGTIGWWDIATYYTSVDGVIIDLTDGLTESGGDALGDTLIGIEQVDGSNFASDTLIAGAGTIILKGFGGDDSLVGSADANILEGNDGNDTLSGGLGADTLQGGVGHDSLIGGNDNDTLEGGLGSDTVVLGDNYGGDSITGGEDAGDGDIDVLDASGVTADGVEIFLSGSEDGYIDSTQGRSNFVDMERFVLTAQNDTLDGRNANSAIIADGGAGADSLLGGSGGDTLAGGDGDDFIDGGAGNDFLTTGLGNDTLMGGLGDDTLMNSDGDDSLDGGAGNDSIVATGGADTLRGGEGDDTMEGGNDADVFIIEDNFGNDVITGGEGTTDPGDVDYDTIDLSALSGPVTVTYDPTGAESGTITDGTHTITFSEIERLILTNQNDSVDGSASHDGLFGDAPGIDVDAGSGDDTVIGGRGGDTIEGGTGADSIVGNYGDDSLLGGDGNDTIIGDELSGSGGGNDTIDGGAGADSIDGGIQSDTLRGGADNDTIDGGTGDDSIEGGTGNDSLTGGDGNDTFSYVVGDGLDTISDFNFGNTGALGDNDTTNNDFIDLSGFYDHINEVRADFEDDGILNQSNSTVSGGDVDYSNNSQFASGEGVAFEGSNRDSFTTDNTGVVCFAAGTLILTEKGEVPVERLRTEDRIATYDNGFQPLVMLASRRLGADELSRNPELKPIEIKAGALGREQRLIISPQHMMLVQHEGNEVLVRARQLSRLKGSGVRVMEGCRQVCYFHLIFDTHQIVFANQRPAESFYPGPRALAALNADAQREFLMLFPDFQQTQCGISQPTGWHAARDGVRTRCLPDRLTFLSNSTRPQ